MTTVIDLTAELAKLTLLRGRTPQTTSADPWPGAVRVVCASGGEDSTPGAARDGCAGGHVASGIARADTAIARCCVYDAAR